MQSIAGGSGDTGRRGEAVGWVGTGRMGAAMVLRLLEAGTPVVAYNRTRAKLEPLVRQGAAAAGSLAEVARQPVVFTTLSSSDDLLAVVAGGDGLLAQETIPSVIVDSSTVSTEASAEVRSATEAAGAEFLAAPVSGNPSVVAAGRLTFAVSGRRSTFDEVLPLLESIGAGATYVGEGERARLVKLCHNVLLAILIEGLVEVTLLAEKGGVDRSELLAYLNQSVVGSQFSSYKTPALVELDFHPTFTSRLLRKDVELGLDAARSLEVPMPVTALVGQLVSTLVGAGHGDEDFASLLALQASFAGVDLKAGGSPAGAEPGSPS